MGSGSLRRSSQSPSSPGQGSTRRSGVVALQIWKEGKCVVEAALVHFEPGLNP